MKPPEFAVRLTEFFTVHLAGTKKVTANTVRSYRDAFALLLRFLRDEKGIPIEKIRVEMLDTKSVLEWLAFLESERGCSPSSRNQRLAAVKSFFRYMTGADPLCIGQAQRVLAIPRCRSLRAPVRYLEPNLVAALLAQPDPTSRRGCRDITMLSFLYDTAARSQETIDTRVCDLRLDAPAQVTLTGKGGKSRIVPLMPSTVSLLRDYLRRMKLDQPGREALPLFWGRDGEPLTRSGLRNVLSRHARSASASHPALAGRIGPHTLRHTKAMHMLQAGVPLIYIRDVLGHVDLKTTEVYARADLEMKRQALGQAALNTPTTSATLPSWRENRDLLDWLTSL